ncbi:MAG: PRC-barrel domain-containing protein [Solirubrobacterales bacterium]|nr:PRC-barrel domain-containing protein [Solirubrobacterales bacterium]
MIRASELLGCAVQTESGKRLGRVHDLRAEADPSGWKLTGLVIGHSGMLSRLVGNQHPSPDPVGGGQLIPWQAITALQDGLITIHDTQI